MEAVQGVSLLLHHTWKDNYRIQLERSTIKFLLKMGNSNVFLSAGRKGRQKKLCDDLEENRSRLPASTEHRPGGENKLSGFKGVTKMPVL